MRFLYTLAIVLLSNAWGAVAATGDGDKAALKTTAKPDVTATAPAREAAALVFVRANHPELTDLLAQLKTSKPQEYEAAIAELFRISEHLSQLQANNSVRYPLELEAWKIKSRIQLLAAEGTMAADEQLKTKLRDALEQQADIRQKLLKIERDQMAERLKKLDLQIEQSEKERQQQVDRQLEITLKSIDRMRTSPPTVTEKKPLTAKPSEK